MYGKRRRPRERETHCLLLFTILLIPITACRTAERAAPKEPLPRDLETVEHRWPDGKLREREHRRRASDGSSVLHGLLTRWYVNGQKEYEVVFVDGKKHGTEMRWHRNGNVWNERRFEQGVRHGPSYTWDELGVKRKEERHAHGAPVGTWRAWNEKGELKAEQRFEPGAPAPQPP
ncbi:MAG: hypothetical protein IH986_04715 [Planctomycetes bacterium]|nr:hypothetical protein [Planctomycetota bacterium]